MYICTWNWFSVLFRAKCSLLLACSCVCVCALYQTPKYLHDDESCTVTSKLLVSVLSTCLSDKGKHCTVYCTCECFTYIFNLFRVFFFVILCILYFICLFISVLFFSSFLFFSLAVVSIMSSLFSFLNLSTFRTQVSIIFLTVCECCCCCCCISRSFEIS